MLGLLNTTSMQKKNGFLFLPMNMDYPNPTRLISAPSIRTGQGLSDMPTMNAPINGLSMVARLFNDNWRHAGTETILTIGDSNNYVYFQKRQSGYKFRFGLVSGGVIQLIDEFTVHYLYDGNVTFGASIAGDRICFCVNGYTISYQTTGITLPSITDADTVEIGYD